MSCTRIDRIPLAPASALAAALLAAAAVAGCFSERGTTGPSADASCAFGLTPDVAGSTIVVVRDFAFNTSEVRVKRGTRVTWVNCEDDGTPAHTSTADAGAWDSPTLAPGASFTQTFDQTGSFPYHCEPHPSMTGRVIVEE
jgi:plastocyanin